MPFVSNDFKCLDCGHEFDELWNKPTGDFWDAWKGEVTCPECASENLVKQVSATGAAVFSLLDKEGKTASLRKRSVDHSKKMILKEADKHRGTIKRKMDAIKNG